MKSKNFNLIGVSGIFLFLLTMTGCVNLDFENGFNQSTNQLDVSLFLTSEGMVSAPDELVLPLPGVHSFEHNSTVTLVADESHPHFKFVKWVLRDSQNSSQQYRLKDAEHSFNLERDMLAFAHYGCINNFGCEKDYECRDGVCQLISEKTDESSTPITEAKSEDDSRLIIKAKSGDDELSCRVASSLSSTGYLSGRTPIVLEEPNFPEAHYTAFRNCFPEDSYSFVEWEGCDGGHDIYCIMNSMKQGEERVIIVHYEKKEQ